MRYRNVKAFHPFYYGAEPIYIHTSTPSDEVISGEGISLFNHKNVTLMLFKPSGNSRKKQRLFSVSETNYHQMHGLFPLTRGLSLSTDSISIAKCLNGLGVMTDQQYEDHKMNVTSLFEFVNDKKTIRELIYTLDRLAERHPSLKVPKAFASKLEEAKQDAITLFTFESNLRRKLTLSPAELFDRRA